MQYHVFTTRNLKTSLGVRRLTDYNDTLPKGYIVKYITESPMHGFTCSEFTIVAKRWYEFWK